MTKKKGTKHDQGKSRLELVEPDWLEDVGHVLAHGAKIHGDENWKLVEPRRYIAASMRHILAISRGEYLDPDTQKPHAAHLACDSMFLHYLGGPRENINLPRYEGVPFTPNTKSERDGSSGVLSDDEAPCGDTDDWKI